MNRKNPQNLRLKTLDPFEAHLQKRILRPEKSGRKTNFIRIIGKFTRTEKTTKRVDAIGMFGTMAGQKENSDTESDAKRLEAIWRGKAIAEVLVYTSHEIAIAFTDGSRLFVNSKTELEISAT